MCRLPNRSFFRFFVFSFFSVLPFPDPSPGHSVTRARRLYESRIANFRSSDRPQTRGSAQGPFSPSLATGTLGHPWPADVHCRQPSQGPFSPSCKKANPCEDSVFGLQGHLSNPHCRSMRNELQCGDKLVRLSSWTADGEFAR